MDVRLEEQLAYEALNIGFSVRKVVNSLPRNKRADLGTSVLKPYEAGKSKMADIVGERAGFEILERLSKNIGHPIYVIMNDPSSGQYQKIGGESDTVVWCSFDAVDGTVKVAGLGNDPSHSIYRVGGNGFWGAGVAFTRPISSDVHGLRVGDFVSSALVQGNPQMYREHPPNAFCFHDDSGVLRTFEADEKVGGHRYSLTVSSQTNISQSMINFESFQGYDRNSAPRECEGLAVEIFKRICNRNDGGAFDYVRFYANISEVLCQLLERKDGGIEPQGAGAITLNENYASSIPFTPIIEGAGGFVVDFFGHPVRDRLVTSSRPNVVIAANEEILKSLLGIVQSSMRECGIL